MRGRIVVAGITALIMILRGVFWMITWLIGTNGYSESKGVTILVSNLLMVILSIVVSSVVSGWLAKELQTRMAWSAWIAAPLAIVAVTAVAVSVLFVASVIIIIVFGRTP